MTEDTAVYEVPRREQRVKVSHLEVVVDYLKGLKYKEITEKYGITRGGVQYALEKFGVKPNRIKSSARLSKKPKIKEHRTKGEYLQDEVYIPIKGEIEKDNNPVLEDDLDIMERMDGTDGTGDLSCEIDINEEGEITYDHND